MRFLGTFFLALSIITNNAFGQTLPQETVSLKTLAFKIYCRFGTALNDDTSHCSLKNRSADSLSVQKTTQVVPEKKTIVAAPQVIQKIIERPIEKIVYIQGQVGPQGPKGDTGANGRDGLQAFSGIPQPFWNGLGSGSVQTTIVSSGTTLPPAGASGTVLTVDASGTLVWLPLPGYSTSSTSTTNTLSSSGNTLTSQVNGVLATSSIITSNIATSTGIFFQLL